MTTESNEASFARSVGRIDWPSGPGYLTDPALCPACFSVLDGIDCPVCGLRLQGEASALLFDASQDASRAMSRRAQLIGRLRFEKEAGARAAAEVVTVSRVESRVDVQPVAPSVPASPPPLPAQPPAPPREQPSAAPAPDAHPRRRSSVQVLLLATGVVLVAVAAVFFLIVAFIANGLLFRSIVIGLLTALAIGLASWLRKRLPATAEGIGALAVAFVLLDIWLARSNDLFGAGAARARSIGARRWFRRPCCS
ncbi:hypothetical protein [Leifsonia poae]|uniref:hypothetical protein n=1 Tax=Leifsonia poae TaxID=110933 RepID=UPI003D67ABB6